ncbi:hypothetical protein P700755_003311 [Psychroflexus torquis ATCC 700755]|uniref:DUF2846 domain-containing protein n=1 Tax=Psychroflexus torquis (strain ATCC 700755 / CIP 106069 / ACAM 623) TaxID=313595 RepID=K4IJF8_PSYTT|nr:hypothetical protein [Psychroflexus torquis]AFU69953.1 hypothetical protein P700755_003311 [Psychroflexus torquis ATCC 700755]
MKTITNLLFIALAIFALNSCALRPIATQYDYQKNNVANLELELEKLGNGWILIYNGADGLHKIDNTPRLNMWIDEKPMGQLRASKYAIIELEKKDYEFKLLHVDMFKFKSTHSVMIDKTTKVIRIEPTITSNKLTITNQLPSRIKKFKYVKSR